jgi:hypothetical protein
MPDILSMNKTITISALPGKTFEETFALFEAFMKHGHTFPQLTSNTKIPIKDVTTQGGYTALAISIPSLTHLATSLGIPD